MLLTISTTYSPATDLGYLLHKHPARPQTFSLSFGRAFVFYPEASEQCCTAALLLDIDTVRLVRGGSKVMNLEQYVNDRPYVASSFLSVAIAEVFGTALNGRCTGKPELATTKMPLQARLAAVPCRKGEEWLKKLFEPLGYSVTATPHILDEQHPDWGMSSYYTVTLEATCCLSALLTHLYVLMPVLDNDKHYWIGDDEVDKLLKRGQGWLEAHPERAAITYRYLKHRHDLTREALARLIPEEQEAEENEETKDPENEEAKDVQESEPRVSVHEQRLEAVLEILQQSGARSVLDLGCGEGRLLKKLLKQKQFERIVGLDVSYRALELAHKRLHLERLPSQQKERIRLIHGALTYRDERLEGYDAAAVFEVIEHLDLPRLAAFERVLFECARPGTVVVTTPNADYNVKFASLQAGAFRHKDHRFEWGRQEFQAWASRIAERFSYRMRYLPIGPQDDEVGSLSHMVVFSRQA
jgi:3' terminal RNA ribose 2'-O-methyltransferase Hen1